MSDICMCQYENCPKSQECYRFKAKPSDYQSYALFQNICNEDNDYEWFWLHKQKKEVNNSE